MNFLLISAIAASVPVHAQSVESSKDPTLLKLGIARLKFGETYFEEFTDQNSPFRYHGMLSDYQTEIYFPAGSSTERYYINKLAESVPKTPILRNQYYLSLNTFTNEKSTRAWSIRLDMIEAAPPIPYLEATMGTLMNIIRNRGLFPREPIPKTVETSLRSQVPLAAYWQRNVMEDQLTYWFVMPDGSTSKPIRTASVTDLNMPMAPFPYPITAEEAT